MPKYRVIAEFIDLEAGQRRSPGEVIEVSSPARVKKLADAGVIDPDAVEETGPADAPETGNDGQPAATAEEQPDARSGAESPDKPKVKEK
ncbi:hypothetical protein [Desulfovirgula thermocuniculi]|uniref:hypothetical protein n=1 Tax=Desulfovirgula thermocuniculi TaxID=348842 RepID=UPI00040F2A59|nr:hypothetical protein [Desulfovirgula thermocuniculi]